ncbi:glycoside hydrolase family 57 protein [Hydrogenimonas sp.]
MALSLNLFWHMHQPDYRNKSGDMHMPWVFLHAIKDYYEMPWLLSRAQGLKATFNVTPPLLEQLLIYIDEGPKRDIFLSLWLKEPRQLSSQERRFVEKICHSAQLDTMVRPFRRYLELYHRDDLSDEEFVELEVLFVLAWCGNYLRENVEEVARLVQKGHGYTQADKGSLLESLLGFLPRVVAIYKEMLEAGRIALATTPYNHPILPLLLDMNNARISNPATPIPPNHFPLPEDAVAQVEGAIELYERLFGRKPAGFWPAEGAVDEKSVAIYKEMGLRWIATDEAILFKSLGHDERAALYRRQGFGGLFIAFRDHGLSDLIGFTYRYWEGEKAAADFVSRLRAIYDADPDAVVSVILDGENAWEFYPHNAFDFFDALYRRLEKLEWCRTVTMDELAEGATDTLSKLHPGSWIYGTFDTWVGHPEKNAAWELLFQTKGDYLHHEKELDAETKANIQAHFLAAECSDWYWWYGEDHYTEYAAEFDELFRSHLIAVYEKMGLMPPANLFKPIAGDKKDLHALVNEPKFSIQPIVDGRVTSFFEWLGSGMIDESRAFSTMDKVRGPVKRLYWGENRDALFLRLDGDMEVLRTATLRIFAKGERVETSIEIDLATTPLHGDISAAADRIVEVGINKRLHFQGARQVRLRLEVAKGDEVLQVLPGVAELTVDLSENYASHWFI